MAALPDRDLPRRARPRRRRLLPILIVLVGLPLAWYAIAWIRHIPAATSDVAGIAHRGASAAGDADRPGEGTLPAFRTAIDAGADWLEFDVRRTSDGALVVLHDATVDRTTNGSGPVAGLTLAELRALDAGAGAVVPTVEDVVRLAVRAGVPVLPEIKDGPLNPGMTGQLVDLLRAAGALDGAVIQAFDAATLEELARIAPESRACWLTGWWQFDISSPPADAAFVCPMGEMVLLAPDVIRQAHAAGRMVFVWWAGVESRPANAIVAAFGADGIIVDDLGSLP